MQRSPFLTTFAVAWIAGTFSVATAPTATAKMKTVYLKKHSMVRIIWTGKIAKPMARQLNQQIRKWHASAQNGFELLLNSRGGHMSEGRRVIRLLRQLKQTRSLKTVVRPGHICGSSCIPIFLQGEQRSASASTLWLLHEVSKTDKKSKKLIALRPAKTQQYFKEYFLPAGVPQSWIDMITRKIRGKDLWWTGRQIYQSGSHFITNRLGNTRVRKVFPPTGS